MPKLTPNSPTNFPLLEEEVLKFWKKNQTFEKSVEMRDASDSYVFYDGPPFATGTPHYGHIVASTMKDIIPRYWTMKGKRVERKWGWDCHGLPIENIAEKEMGMKQKKEILELGIDKFNEICRSKVLGYVDEWRVLIDRLGRWADMDHAYKTMDLDFMESVWWVFKQLWDNELIYQSHNSMHICPRCETTLSQSEVSEGYKDITDLSVIAEFKVKNPSKLIETEDQVFLLAWTTTPWTLPGNFLLALNSKETYALFKGNEAGKMYIAMRSRLAFVTDNHQVEIVKELSGKELLDLEYEPLFPYFSKTTNAFRVTEGDFVSIEEGTGIVHIAPGFGQDDYALGKRENVELIQHVGYDGRFTDQVTDFRGLEVKPREDHQSTDIEIIKYLAHHDRLWSKKKITHSYPHCWRCDTPLLNYATSSWFVNVTKIKQNLLTNAEEVNWMPEHIKTGRFGKWLDGARDWSISRQRFWASVMPIWQCECGEQKVYGSVSQLEEDSGQKISDLHKHVVDKITVPCTCGNMMHRIPDVLDTWFDSGSMPYAQAHYPFENKSWFEANFPAEFIAEGVDQTRAWFYYLHVIAGGIKHTNAFKNVIVNGIVLAQDGKKMSKRLKNYPDPKVVLDNYGADSLRLYLASSPVMKAENLNFIEKEVADIRRKTLVIWQNVISFYLQYAHQQTDVCQIPPTPSHVLDRWLLSRLNNLIKEVTFLLDSYDLVKSSRLLMEFVDDLSTWYLRLSRDRFREKTNEQASHVLGFTIYSLAKLYAPYTPFFTEVIHHTLVNDQTSIHHSNWPKFSQQFVQTELEQKMNEVKKVVEMARAERQKAGLKLRQPLSSITVYSPINTPDKEILDLIAQETNVKKVIWRSDESLSSHLDTKLTKDLQEEGSAREIMRQIQDLRKKAKLQPDEQISVQLPDEIPTAWRQEIIKKTNVAEIQRGDEAKII